MVEENLPVDPGGLSEFSVVFTDRSLNHMSKTFQGVMTDISGMLKHVYNADHVAIVPGGGTYAMEAVARQFASRKHALVVRNGWFSYRWSQIFEAGNFTARTNVLRAAMHQCTEKPAYTPPPLREVQDKIIATRPDVVFAPHVETSAGLILTDAYIKGLAKAAHEVGALLVLDCIASGCVWVDMKKLGIDVVISAPQKGWSSTPCAGLVMMSKAAREKLDTTSSSSFANDLKKWTQIMDAYEGGGHAYHATMPTDGLRALRDTMVESRTIGFEKLAEAQWALGRAVRAGLAARGIASVAHTKFAAPGVVVSYTDDPNIKNGSNFAAKGMQIAAGVPLKVGEPEGFSTFRLGLFGLDKLTDVQGTLDRLNIVLDAVLVPLSDSKKSEIAVAAGVPKTLGAQAPELEPEGLA